MEFATGKEARQALEDLLGLTSQSSAILVANPAQVQNWGEAAEAIKEAYDDQNRVEALRTEAPKTTRRTKAQIEAEKLAAEKANETPAAETAPEESKPEETKPEETNPETTVTKEDLQKKAVELGRVGKKELCRAVLQKHGADSISTADKNPLKVELYATVLNEFNKL